MKICSAKDDGVSVLTAVGEKFRAAVYPCVLVSLSADEKVQQSFDIWWISNIGRS